MLAMLKSAPVSLRIIAEENHGHWSAWFADPSSHETYGGADAMDAVRRLIENSPQWNVTEEDFEPGWDNCSSRRLELVLVGPLRKACPDCGGTGKYVGLNVVEPCTACGGTGEAGVPPLAT